MREKLLIVEDDPAIQRMIGDYFRHVGYDIVTASDGETGVRMAQNERPTAMILDLMLPKLDGMSLLARLCDKQDRPHVLILTANDRVEDRPRRCSNPAIMAQPSAAIRWFAPRLSKHCVSLTTTG